MQNNHLSESDDSERDRRRGYFSRMDTEVRSVEFWRAVISECIATFFYTFFVCFSTLWTKEEDRDDCSVLYISLAAGLCMMMLLQCFGHVSGGHFNPAVTLPMVCTGKITILRGVCYIISQCGGAIAGAAALYGITPADRRGQLGMNGLAEGIGRAQGFGLELMLTFITVFTLFATVAPERKMAGSPALAIGLSVTAAHLVGVRMTGCAINPARCLGPAFIMNKWNLQWLYWAAAMAGGLISGLLYEYIFDPYKKPCNNAKSRTNIKMDQLDTSSAICNGSRRRKEYTRVGTGCSTNDDLIPETWCRSLVRETSSATQLTRATSIVSGKMNMPTSEIR